MIIAYRRCLQHEDAVRMRIRTASKQIFFEIPPLPMEYSGIQGANRLDLEAGAPFFYESRLSA